MQHFLLSVFKISGERKGTAMRKNAKSVLLIAVLLFTALAGGCAHGNWMAFKCSADNVLGLTSVYISGKTVTLNIDKDKAEPFWAMQKVFEEESKNNISATFFMNGKENVYFSADDIAVDKENQTITINAKDVKLGSVTGLRIRYGLNEYKVDFKNKEIEANNVFIEGEGSYTIDFNRYTQTYDSKNGTWSEPELETSQGEFWT